jgi:hypothetical protein
MLKIHFSFSQSLSIAAAFLLGTQIAASGADIVEFSFTGKVVATNGPGLSDLPASVIIGASCFGHVAYTYSPKVDTDPSPNAGSYNMSPTELAISLTIANDTFSSGTNQPKTITVYNDAQQPLSDQLAYLAFDYLINGNVAPGNLQNRTLSVGFNTTNLNTLVSDALPVVSPRIEDFPAGGGAGYRLATCYCYRSNAFYYGFSVEIDNIIAFPKLAVNRTGNHLELRWPTNLVGYQIESATNFVAGEVTGHWSPCPQAPLVTGADFKLSVGMTNPMQFFRLRKIDPD